MDGELNQAADPNIVHKGILEMFPELDLTNILAEFGHLTPDGLVGVVIDRMALIPRKKHGTKRKAEDANNEEVLSEYSSVNSETADLQLSDLLVDKMLGELLRSCKAELRSKRAVVDASAWTGIKTLMIEHFPMVRADFITRIVRLFNGAIVPTAIACFFVENNFGDKLQKIVPALNRALAVPIQSRIRRLKHAFVSEQLREYFKLYNELMSQYQMRYPELLSGLKLTQQARHIALERSEQEQLVECLVCFERVTLHRMVCCTAPSAEATHLQQPGRDDDDDEVLLVDLSSGSSGEVSRTVEQLDNEGRGEAASPAPSHAFCRGCIRGQAQAATDEIPLAEGGVGVKCMVPDCKNPILYSDIRILLKREVRRKLDERIVEENIGMASLQNLERCKLCNFAIEMEVDKSVNKVFDCLKCGAKFCRLCERRWDEDHFGISCDELDGKMKKDKRDRDLEKKLNEAVIRKCPRCGLPFMKDEGCNKMTCRCGMKQCYLCRQSNIDYSHFCRHLRDPKVPNWKCNMCNKKCLLFEDANKLDSIVVDQIRVRQEQEERQLAAGEGTSAEGQLPQPQLDQLPTTSRGTRGNGATAHRRMVDALIERSRRLTANLQKHQSPDNRRQNTDDPFVPFTLYGAPAAAGGDGGGVAAAGLQAPMPAPYRHQQNAPQPFAQPIPYQYGQQHQPNYAPQDPRIYRQNAMFYNQQMQFSPFPQHGQRHQQFVPQDPRIYQQQQNQPIYQQQMPAFYNQQAQQPQYTPTSPLNRLSTVPQPNVAGAEMMMPPVAMVDVALADAEHAIQMFYNGGGGVPAQQPHQQNNNRIQ